MVHPVTVGSAAVAGLAAAVAVTRWGPVWWRLWQREAANLEALAAAKQRLGEEASRVFPYTAAELQQALQNEGYFLDSLSAKKLWSYLRQGKPVGLRGEPGIGKSQLAEAFARAFGYPLVDMECHSHLEAEEIGISWNGFKQIVDAQAYQRSGSGEPPNLYTLEYLNRTPLLESVLAERPTVVRVDEVDKLNEHTTNFFLRYLDKQELVVHNLDHPGQSRVLKARAPLYIFLTSNEYKRLDTAFMRRTVWLDLQFPSEATLARIIQRSVGVPADFAARVARIVVQLRQLNMEKKPAIAEAIEWARALVDVGDGRITPESVEVTIGFLAKYPEDEAIVKEALRQWYDGFGRSA
ncbi:AAA family ATPase [Symbiobacterium thermophilum]|uniref:AAA family ATPase n=1 Tax=Symbiobacterium thermophilum TaxID=2734 RepID=UPI00030896F7|nr:MoxR family ATPase [Symbiobacterium thermophilum]